MIVGYSVYSLSRLYEYKYRTPTALKTKKAPRLTWALNVDNRLLTSRACCVNNIPPLACLPLLCFCLSASGKNLQYPQGCVVL